MENLVQMVNGALKTVHIFNTKCKELNIKTVSLLNVDTLCCEFYPVAKTSTDIKLEMSTIVGCFNGLFRNNTYENVDLKNYVIKAYDNSDNEILYALCTKSTAELIGTGEFIEWYTRTLFQENTEDFRLAQAKKIISEIENGLREIVKIKLREKFGNDWWEAGLSNKLGKDVKEIYVNQFEVECTDGDILIAYTYTLQLKKIILTHFNLFKSYFKSTSLFENLMDNLNKIRREEAHNRPISQVELKNLEELHKSLLADLLADLTSFQSVFLTENWRIKIKKIMIERQYKSIYSEHQIVNETDLEQKFLKINENMISLISYLNDTIIKLKSVIVPIYKKNIQQELLFCYEKRKELHQSLLLETLSLNYEKIDALSIEINSHEQKMDEFSKKFILSES
ncbi:Swt1 family HEPN domain-containing protein [Chryseobacterium sp. H1D6B]|uniref:Swt1 family HEPN domain-containing protein n=1 Tax=Chryseobacterium sp. H1D6B TaxID=2940588 RepID=UPI0015C905C6|nr:Swt1 family HEPN domain-containing protein [Chryseobacterium sp. H1D6B]